MRLQDLDLDEVRKTPENDLGYQRPWLYDKQLGAVFNPCRYSCVEASTKAGKTVACIAWILEQAILSDKKSRNFWWIAPVSDQSDIAFRRIQEALPPGMFNVNLSRKYITLKHNGARIWFKSGDKPDSLYGEDVYGAVIDEASRVKEESWHAIRSTVTATKAPLRIIGNVKGRANWFYRISQEALKDESGDMYYEKITAYDAIDAGVLDPQEIEDAKKIYPPAVFKELYMAEPGDDGGNPFGIENIYACIKPLSRASPVCWGWDVAKHNNYTVGIALDDNGNVCRFHRFQDTFDVTFKKMVNFTNGVNALIDSTGSGDQLLERLHIDGHSNFKGQLFGGWKAKYDLMVGLAAAIHNQEIGFPDGRIVEELEAFEYYSVPNSDRWVYAAPSGFNDDCVDALAMAVKLYVKRDRYGLGGAMPISYEKTSAWTTI